MPKGSRQYHGKTKNGCRQCKKRRVKCDCIGPVCANCRRRQEHCSYLGLLADTLNRENGGDHASDTLAMVRRAATVAAHASSRDALNASLPAEKLRADEAELKHHFLTQAWFTFSLQNDPRKCYVWSRWLPQLASRNVFIHQSMLSVAALHLCYLNPPDVRRYYSMACQHAIQASNYFRLAVPEVTEENWLATYVFSMCNGIFGYYRPFADEKVVGQVTPFEPAKSLGLMRVAAKFSDTVTPHVFRSPIRDKLAQVNARQWHHSSNVALRPALRKVARFAEFLSSQQGTGEDGGGCCGEAATYLGALAALRSWIESLPGRPRIWKHFILWPSLVSEQYLALLRVKRPVALMLFAVWCEVMFLAPRRWYLTVWHDRRHADAMRELTLLPDSPAKRFWESLVAMPSPSPPPPTMTTMTTINSETDGGGGGLSDSGDAAAAAAAAADSSSSERGSCGSTTRVRSLKSSDVEVDDGEFGGKGGGGRRSRTVLLLSTGEEYCHGTACPALRGL